MKYFLIILSFFIASCSDPVNQAISEFKKSNLAKSLFNCGGVTAKYEYKVIRSAETNKETLAIDSKAPSLVVSVTKELNKGKPITLEVYYKFNPQTFIFQQDGYFKVTKDLPETYKYENFCADENPISIKEEVKDDFRIGGVWDSYKEKITNGITIKEFENIVSNESNIVKSSRTNDEQKFCVKNSSVGFIVTYPIEENGNVIKAKLASCA